MIIQDFLLKRRWIVLTSLLAAITLATSAYLIYREVYRPKPANVILSKYGYLFRQRKEMDILNLLIKSQRPLPVNETSEHSIEQCSLSCSIKPYRQQSPHQANNNGNTTESVRQRNDTGDNSEVKVHYIEPEAAALRDDSEDRYIHHGCCLSQQEYLIPTKLKHATTDKWLRIVQFRTHGQFFLTDKCQHIKGCDRGCRCRQQLVTAVAVVVDFYPKHKNIDEGVYMDYIEKNARIESVQYPGWCKCFND